MPLQTCYHAFVASVLGIDAAWTECNPSGVALVTGASGRWRCAAIAPSYASFLALANGLPVRWDAPKVEGGVPYPSELLAAARKLGKAEADIVAVDMPLATVPIVGRRAADSAISREFGASGCSTHTASPRRPGVLSDRLRSSFEGIGFRLATQPDEVARRRRLSSRTTKQTFSAPTREPIRSHRASAADARADRTSHRECVSARTTRGVPRPTA